EDEQVMELIVGGSAGKRVVGGVEVDGLDAADAEGAVEPADGVETGDDNVVVAIGGAEDDAVEAVGGELERRSKIRRDRGEVSGLKLITAGVEADDVDAVGGHAGDDDVGAVDG